MESDASEPTGDLGYDTVHADLARQGTGGRPRPPDGAPEPDQAAGRDDAAGDLGYDEAHDFRR
jgi:hypothetical protein